MDAHPSSRSFTNIANESERGALPRARTALAWAAFLCLSILPLLPGRSVLVDAAAGVGIVLIAWRTLATPERLAADRLLHLGLALFAATVFVSVFYPALAQFPHTVTLANALHAAWATVRAAVLGGLALMLLRTRKDWTAAAMLLIFAVFVIVLWAPPDAWVRARLPYLDGGEARLVGTKGTAHRFAVLLYFGSLLAWLPLLCKPIRTTVLPRWAVWTGRCGAIALPAALLRKGLPATSGAAQALIALTVLLAVIGLMVWEGVARAPRRRYLLSTVTFVLCGANLALAEGRLHLALTILASVLCLAVASRAMRRMLLPLCGLMAAGALVVLSLLPLGYIGSSMWFRVQIWKGSVALFQEHPILGVGYGADNFRRSWQPMLPPPGEPQPSPRARRLLSKLDAHHAHNLWLEIAAERGIVGLVGFHALWLAALVRLGRLHRSLPPPAGRVAFLGLVTGLLLVADGMLNHPVQGAGETYLWLLVGMGLAAGHGLNAGPVGEETRQEATGGHPPSYRPDTSVR